MKQLIKEKPTQEKGLYYIISERLLSIGGYLTKLAIEGLGQFEWHFSKKFSEKERLEEVLFK